MKFNISPTADCLLKRIYTGHIDYNSIAHVPAGMEVILIKGGQISDVFREGDGVINPRRGLFFKKAPDEECQLYLASRSKQFTVLWGAGGIAVNMRGEPVIAGANGSYRVTVDNSRALLRRFGYPEIVDETVVKNELKSAVSGAVREAVAAYYRAGARGGGAAVEDGLLKRLTPEFLNCGLFLDSFRVDEISETGNAEPEDE